MPDLLIELFSEEIPARMQKRASEDLKKLVTDGLVEAGLTYASAGAFATPRRLTLSVEDLLAQSPTTVEERKGPRIDAPEKALAGFLRGAGVAKEDLGTVEEKKGTFYVAKITKEGRPAAPIIAEVLENAIRNFPWPKSMRWGTGSLKWVRPLHSIICVLSAEDGSEVVEFDIDGIVSGRTTRGHRFMAPDAFSVNNFDDYSRKLKSAYVMLDASERADHIWHDATNQAFAQGLEVVEDKGLLVEVAGLVEWPVVLMGNIGDDFLGLPPEVLQTSMKEHQKFFSVRNPKTARIEKFVTVANRETADQGATILAGNEKVLSARLADAKFFWDNDIRTVEREGFEAMAAPLANVTFHNKLGSQSDRIARIAALAREIAPIVGADADEAELAAKVAKADLSSEMVYEFPELQGIMGRYYAKKAGLSDAVADACRDHYSPLGPSDDVPTDPVSVAVALADKLDTLTGFWAIEQKPTGSKDPFALRRAALGVIRLIVNNEARVSLRANFYRHIVSIYDRLAAEHSVLKMDLEQYAEDGSLKKIRWVQTPYESGNEAGLLLYWRMPENDLGLENSDESDRRIALAPTKTSADLLSFFHDRLKVFLKDEGIRHDVIDACLAMDGADDITLLVKRARALSETLATEDGQNLIQGFKRANNILSQAEAKDGVEYSYGPDIKFAESDVEKALFAALDTAEAAIKPAMASEDFASAMSAMAAMRASVDAFFEAVQVNADNEVVRRNRLNLLGRIRDICLSVADLTKLDG
ncbi:glycine--tRNA ligase subunit beta [Pacificibacter marinus]|uniref:Glycine--tRNA ligase beta subunit n=1 Tax=Pacificibacter marinus TaxID=658057 RepID=A0A1Y5SPZ3_9RHOB|nr:glycine--tRNA ligase subunit beta [Pacificibacter marinus]SEK69068.1 glycyl-tRNA synthetase beta chain [Pacificibacter marinus]SLN45702.1 Glycine--tRNA ligase beta subunit [Pacificibacter marinus]